MKSLLRLLSSALRAGSRSGYRAWQKAGRRLFAGACLLLACTGVALAGTGSGATVGSSGAGGGSDTAVDDYCLWTAFSVRRMVSERWHMGARAELRLHDHFSTVNQYYLRPFALYSIGKYLRAGLNVDLVGRSSGFSMRYIPELSLHWGDGDWRFMLRQWYMASYTPAWGLSGGGSAGGSGAGASSPTALWSHTARTKFQAIRRLPDTPLSLRCAIEPFYWDRFSKCRFFLGASCDLGHGHSLLLEALREQYISRPSNNVLVLSWSLTL